MITRVIYSYNTYPVHLNIYSWLFYSLFDYLQREPIKKLTESALDVGGGGWKHLLPEGEARADLCAERREVPERLQIALFTHRVASMSLKRIE